jgi:preprotein translocase subunit SecA
MIFHVEVEVEGAEPPQLPASQGPVGMQYSGGAGTAQPSAFTEVAQGGGVAPEGYAEAQYGEEPDLPVVQQRRVDEHDTIGRNDPCWCGSGKKYKKCHGA